MLAVTRVVFGATRSAGRDERSGVAREVVAWSFDVGSESRSGGCGGAGDVALW